MIRPLHYVEDIFGENGLFHSKIPGYQPRHEQIELANHIALSLAEGTETFVSEAPCGTGKTYAYLVPLLYHRHWRQDPVLVSTAGISLQMQLVEKDLPRLKALLCEEGQEIVPPFTFTLLKGVNNYACTYKMERTFVDSTLQAEIADTLTGDRESLMHLSDETWSQVSTNSEGCDTEKCPAKDRCYYIQQRKKARVADVVVTNHHFTANLSDESPILSLQGKRRLVVLDEAHEYPSIARDARSPQAFEPTFRKVLRKLSKYRDDAETYKYYSKMEEGVDKLFNRPVSASLMNEASLLPDVLRSIQDNYMKLRSLEGGDEESGLAEWNDPTNRRLGSLRAAVKHADGVVLKEESGAKTLHIVNTTTPFFEGQLMALSATLRCEKSYNSWLDQVHRQPSESNRVARFTTRSPFDWTQQVRVILPNGGKDPAMSRDTYPTYVAEVAMQVVQAAKGRTLVLCTSWTSVRTVAEALSTLPYRVLVQGTMGKKDLVDTFKLDTHSVLVGTTGLWTGVDVPGEALSALILDKLPFRTAKTPASLIQKMQNPKGFFSAHVLPEAVNLFAQGFGRLIRSTQDKGVVVLLDNRLYTKPYGQAFRDALPPDAPITRDLGVITPFLEGP